MYNLEIRKFTSPPPPSPEVENFKIKIYYPAGDRTPDLLNQRCYHLSQRGEHVSMTYTIQFYYYNIYFKSEMTVIN